MSETTSDGGIDACLPNVSTSPCDSPTLSELSPKDKPWDKHRANTDRVTGHYANSRYDRYAQRMTFCSELLDFKLSPSQQNDGVLKLKLSSARFCRVRHCPVCQWRRSLMWKSKACKILPKIVQDYPSSRWLFLTLTVKNCPIEQLRATLTWMNESFKRMTKLKAWPVQGWIKSTEVTRGRDGGAHPHFHCLLMVPPSYFSGQQYLSQMKWADLWQQCLRTDYQPMIHVRAIAKQHDPTVIVPEILKYQTKESDLVVDRDWLLEYTRQMHKTRAISTGGVLKEYLKELEEEPDDLIGKDDEDNSPDEGHLYFAWKRRDKKYRMVNE